MAVSRGPLLASGRGPGDSCDHERARDHDEEGVDERQCCTGQEGPRARGRKMSRREQSRSATARPRAHGDGGAYGGGDGSRRTVTTR